ncbi:hypothetical protein cand_028970 [Cryptosporidium andersoni]|uniref:TPR repeat-containing protein n=1 Tax=Cryptosporidium andersoni TaxID=117008 RepID=A0A1J4MSD9_9CRYT|nr:hypothetical protein cand_028970 [Cryptosporidium andersoni]
MAISESLNSLPNRCQQQFKQIVHLYDQRVYKRALKLADGMLKKYPNQSDILAMKAFILAALYTDPNDARHKEAYECVKKSIKLNMKNPMCWHCLGTLYRSDHDYNEANKCFKNALKFDRNDMVVLRDLATVYIQTRNYAGYREKRNEILKLRPDLRVNWVAVAIGNHLCGYYNSAISSLMSLDSIGQSCVYIDNKEKDRIRLFPFLDSIQASELILYFVMILIDAGRYQQAIEFLKDNEAQILDRTIYLFTLGYLYLYCNINIFRESYLIFEELLKLYPDDDYAILGFMMTSKDLDGIIIPPKNNIFDIKTKCGEIEEIRKQEVSYTINNLKIDVHPLIKVTHQYFHPRSSSGIIYFPLFGRILIDKQDENSPNNIDRYGWKEVERISNNTFMIINCNENNKVSYDYSMEILNNFFEELETRYPKSDSIKRIAMAVLSEKYFEKRFREYVLVKVNKNVSTLLSIFKYICEVDISKKKLIHTILTKMITEKEDNLTSNCQSDNINEIMASLYSIYAQHLDCMGYPLKGLEFINKALSLVDDRADYYSIKSKLLKHLHKFKEASDNSEFARTLENNDRYLNTKAISAYLKNGDINKAIELAKIFTTQPEINKINKLKKELSKDKNEHSNNNESINLQIIWFDKRIASCYEFLLKDQKKSLEYYFKILDSIDTMFHDQYDYHLYCLRKLTLSRYIEFLRMQDKIFSMRQYRIISVRVWKILWYILYNNMKAYQNLEDNLQSHNSKSSNFNVQESTDKNRDNKKNQNLDKNSQTITSSKLEERVFQDYNVTWNKAHEIVQHLRSDAMFYCKSQVVTYIHYFLSFKINKISRETSLAVCSQSLHRLYILENYSVNIQDNFGLFPTLLGHFCLKFIPEVFSIDINEESSNLNFILDLIYKQMSDYTGGRCVDQLTVKSSYINFLYNKYTKRYDCKLIGPLIAILRLYSISEDINNLYYHFITSTDILKLSGSTQSAILLYRLLLLINQIDKAQIVLEHYDLSIRCFVEGSHCNIPLGSSPIIDQIKDISILTNIPEMVFLE